MILDHKFGTIIEVDSNAEFALIFYALLIIFSFFKLLNVLKISNNISFIVKMLGEVTVALLPFLTLFIGSIIVFAFIMHTLNVDLDQVEEMPYEGLGFAGYVIFIFRTSLGDFDVDPF